jgi:hypothetical protein
MNDEFRRQHARTVRSIAEKADPFTKKRLLALADRYDGNRDTSRPLPLPTPERINKAS